MLKKILITFLLFCLVNSTGYAANVEDYPAVDSPFHSTTINHTEERGKKTEEFQPPAEIEITPPVETENLPVEDEGEGLEFLMYNENGVQAFAVIAAHEKYILRPLIAQHQIKGRSTVMQMAAELNDIATINAGYFAPDGSLYGVTKINGRIVATDYFNRSAIGITAENAVIFGRVKYTGKIILNGEEIYINGVNCERGKDRIVIYNDAYSSTTGTNNFGVEIIVADGFIYDIQRGKGNNRIPAGGYVISAHGTSAEFFANAKIGDEIDFDEDIESEDADFNSAEYVIGAGPRLVQNGEVFITAVEEDFPPDIRIGRAPRSAVGVTKYGDYIFAVVDGRQSHSRGCTLQEWAEILIDKFGAFNAINLDGGGSTELSVKDKLVNSPSDGKERPVGSVLTILPK